MAATVPSRACNGSPGAERSPPGVYRATADASVQFRSALAWHVWCFPTVTPTPVETTLMDANKNDNPNLPEALSSSEYRARLTTKLNCLIAVLEVAIGKIQKSMDLPGANEDRLQKIRANLENTLSICHRAKQTLERTANGGKVVASRPERTQMSARDYVELSSIDEYRKFRKMDPITKNELETLDFDELARRLTES